MRVVVLSWDVHDERGGVPLTTSGLLRGLLDAGHDVRLVAPARAMDRLALPPEVTAPVADAAPIIPAEVGGALAPVLAFSSRATTAAQRVVDRRGTDVVLADGWQTAWTATALRDVHGLPIVAHLDSTSYLRHGNALPDDMAVLVHQVEWWLAYESRRVTSSTPELAGLVRRALHVPRAEVAVVPPAIVPVAAAPPRPGRGLPRVAVLLPPDAPRGTRSALRRRLRGVARVVGEAGDGPQAVVALAPTALPAAIGAIATSIPLAVDPAGPLRRLVHAWRTGAKVGLDVDALAATIADLVGPRGATWAAAGRARAQRRHDPAAVAAAWLETATAAIREEGRLQEATHPGSHLRPVPPLPR